MNNTVIQAVAVATSISGMALGGQMLNPLLKTSEQHGLRYTDLSVDGAPPFVAVGTAIGALRGLIVDYLWIKVNIMKEKGLYYEVMADAELITKLQPRFSAVWAFHGHNMAYNISVACQTVEERWDWVNAGIRLVRNKGLRYNPNDLVLHRELAFWFAHKIEGYSDDAHLYYKRAFCREWHFVLGRPPDSVEDRVAWIKVVADAAGTLQDAERRSPGVAALVAAIDQSMTPLGEERRFKPDREFLLVYGRWQSVKEQSDAARIKGIEREWAGDPFFRAFDKIASDPSTAEAWQTLLAFVRKRVLIDEYNMSPQLMYEYTRDLGPIDWRHGSAHSLYWARRGSQLGEARVNSDDDIYKMLNNDRAQIQAIQDLARFGRISFDPFSSEIPSRFPDPRWVDTIDDLFEHFYSKHYETRGGGGETFITFLQNFMGSAIREAYRSGEHARAQALLDRLDSLFGRGAEPPNPLYMVPLDVFVKEQIKGEYSFQPHLAPSEAAMSMRYAFREGVGRDRPDVYDDAVEFVDIVIKYFRGNAMNDYITRYGTGRMKEIMGNLEIVKPVAFLQLMTDPTIGIAEKATIWGNIDKHERELRYQVYDRILPSLQQQYARHEISQETPFEQIFPEPPGMAAWRIRDAAMKAQADKVRAEQPKATLESK